MMDKPPMLEIVVTNDLIADRVKTVILLAANLAACDIELMDEADDDATPDLNLKRRAAKTAALLMIESVKLTELLKQGEAHAQTSTGQSDPSADADREPSTG